jgi:hypothetical protein
MERIDRVVASFWNRLVTGEKIDLPAWQVEHPRFRPDIFTQPGEAWPVGQSYDYVWQLTDGSRIHAQGMTVNGEFVVRIHRDKFDPDRSLGHLVMHSLTETPVGPVLGVFALILALGWIGSGT